MRLDMGIGMHLLTSDMDRFAREYPTAAQFLREAMLRKEYYVLLLSERRGTLSDNQTYRLRELQSGCPALEEAWYLEFLRREGVGPWAKEISK